MVASKAEHLVDMTVAEMVDKMVKYKAALKGFRKVECLVALMAVELAYWSENKTGEELKD